MRPLLLAALALLVSLPTAAAPLAICDGSTAVTLLGMDTASGRMLFSIPSTGEDGRGWLVELDPEGREARAWPNPPKGLFGGSVGPGPVLAVTSCGTSCLQPMRWTGGASDSGWEPLGDPLTSPTAATVTPTYDNTGAPWVILHGASRQDGQIQAWAFRMEGREWKNVGGQMVTAVGQPSALPAPQRKDGVLTGTALFSSSGRPEVWVTGVPSLPAERRGQIIALTGTSAAYVSADGVVYLSDDSGKGWRRSTWTPWGTQSTAGMWRQGTDYWVDLPVGDHRGALRLVWFDRRRPTEETVVLTRLAPSGDWIRLSETRSEVRSKSGEQLPVTQVLVPKGEIWLLLSGCAATAQGSGFVLRSFDGTALSASRFVPFRTR